MKFEKKICGLSESDTISTVFNMKLSVPLT